MPTATSVLRRMPGVKDRVTRDCPTLFAEYNRYMGGTDLCDQRRGNYTTQRRSKKWWHSLFYFTLDILMVCMHACVYDVCMRITHHTHTPFSLTVGGV